MAVTIPVKTTTVLRVTTNIMFVFVHQSLQDNIVKWMSMNVYPLHVQIYVPTPMEGTSVLVLTVDLNSG